MNMTKTIGAAAVAACGFCGFAADFVTYEEFGAKGDGKADDLPAIVKAHEAANAKGLPVRARDGATYYIGPLAITAKIGTDTDFGTARFVIDDTVVSNCNVRIFDVPPTEKSYTVTGAKALALGQTSIGARLKGRAMVHVEDATHRQYRRTGNINMVNNGEPMLELLMVNADGSIDPKTPVTKPVTNVTRMTVFPSEPKRLTLSGGYFITLPTHEIAELWHKWNGYHRGFIVRRSNVLVTGMRHEVIGRQIFGMCPYYDFVKIHNVSDVEVADSIFFSHRKTTHGTYDLDAWGSLDVRFIRCRESTDINDTDNWPCFGVDYCRDVLMDHCEFWRFDAHRGVCNPTILNSRLHVISVVGTGTLRVENTRVEGDKFIYLRGDYGSNWDGDIIIRNCTLAPFGDHGRCTLVAGGADRTHDYGFVCHLGRKIVVDGLTVKDVNTDGKPRNCTLFNCWQKKEDMSQPFAYVPPEEIVLKNVKTTTGKKPVTFNNDWFFTKTKLVEE